VEGNADMLNQRLDVKPVDRSAPTVATATGPSSDGPVLLALRDVSYSYATGPEVMHEFTLSIPRGDVVALVGPSGCGKSTILGMLAGFLQPTHGSIARSSELLAPGARPLTMVFQDDTVLPWKTVAGNLRFGMRYVSITKSDRERRIDDLLGLARLSDVKDRYPYQLSGGQRRRVAFLTAVAPNPRVLLLDEPFAALDEPTRLSVHRDVLVVIRELGMTVVLVTHDLAEAVTLSSNLHVLTARPTTIARTYRTPFPLDRDVFTLRETPGYLSMYKDVWHELRAQITAADGDTE
jgi:NitT/TauT family transport system ATP-binding protein